ncbi:MAG: hypothetical protein Q7S17_06525 [Xanthobacteraceae bacterium]|nr:hypothetical protein [Xanthobacteraceae bacterium]
MNVQAFLKAIARYFANRPTDGEDRSHWVNMVNAKNCEKAAAEVAELVEALENCIDAMCADNPAEGWKDTIDAGDAVLSRIRGEPKYETEDQ